MYFLDNGWLCRMPAKEWRQFVSDRANGIMRPLRMYEATIVFTMAGIPDITNMSEGDFRAIKAEIEATREGGAR